MRAATSRKPSAFPVQAFHPEVARADVKLVAVVSKGRVDDLVDDVLLAQ